MAPSQVCVVLRMPAQVRQPQAVLQPLWFRAGGQRGMAKPVSAESHEHTLPAGTLPSRRLPEEGIPAFPTGSFGCPHVPKPTETPFPHYVDQFATDAWPQSPHFQIRSTSQHGERTVGPSLCPLSLSRQKERSRGQGLSSLSCRWRGGLCRPQHLQPAPPSAGQHGPAH